MVFHRVLWLMVTDQRDFIIFRAYGQTADVVDAVGAQIGHQFPPVVSGRSPIELAVISGPVAAMAVHGKIFAARE